MNLFQDPISPYFLTSADYTNSSLVAVLLDGDNYQRWRRAMLNVLRAKNKLGFINGVLKKPTDNPKEALAWSKCDGLVISWLTNSINPILYDSIVYHETALDMWKDLEERFGHSNEQRIHELHCEIATMTQGATNVSSFFTRIKGAWDELNSHMTIPKCTCDAAMAWQAERDKEKVHQFLMGLNDSFKTLHSQILAMEPLPILNRIYSMVVTKERVEYHSAQRDGIS